MVTGMKKILIANCNCEIRKNIEDISDRLGADCIVIPKNMYNHTVAELAGIKVLNSMVTEYNGNEFSMEMVVFSNLSDKELDLFLDLCRKSQTQIRLKAVVTNDNSGWSLVELYNELMREYLFYKMSAR